MEFVFWPMFLLVSIYLKHHKNGTNGEETDDGLENSQTMHNNAWPVTEMKSFTGQDDHFYVHKS